MAGLRFLIIDPDQVSAGKIKENLEIMGFQPAFVSNAEQGLELVQSGQYEVVIASIISPINENIDFFKQIALSDKIEEVVVITDPNHKKQALEAFGVSVWAYLLTPVDSDELKAIVNRISGYSCLSREVTDKAKRLSHLEVVNEIAREALLQKDSNQLLWLIVRLIHEKLNFYNVNIFEIDEKEKLAVLKAFAGGYGDDLVVGYSLRLGEGMVGWTAQNRQSLLSGDAQNEPRRIQGFDFEKHVHSELSVPIMFNDRVLGVLHVESGERHAFSRDDVMVLETLADQISLTLEKMRLSRELLNAYELGASVNDSLPLSIIILDQDLKINYVNRTFCDTSHRPKEEFNGKPIEHALSYELRNSIDIENGLRTVLKTGNSVVHNNVHHASFSHIDKTLNISLVRVRTGESPSVMILIRDITETTEKTYQLTMLREISIAMQGILERDKLLHLILTCVTAGFAFGFNRAFIFLVDDKREELRGIMGVGPKNREDAYRIWNELTGKGFTFHEYLDKIQKGEIEPGELQGLVQEAIFDLNAINNILTQTVKSGCHFHINNAWDNGGVDEGMKRMNISNEFVTIPLIAKNQVIGVLFADNAYSEKPITPESIEVLTMFASHAGLAIENARILLDLEEKVTELQEAYIELENTHDMLVRNEKLAAIGEVSARLAHEIRNPLSTIGGFAKSIPSKYENKERTIRNANIIVDEVKRLESILTNVLDFAKPSVPKKTLCDINELIKSTLSIIESDLVSNSIVVSLGLSQEKLEAELDEAQIKQVLINVIQNAVNAMSDGGALEILTYRDNNDVMMEFKDTGKGIPEQYLEDIFEPFFTTRGNGTGLGLSISNRIVQNHRGRFLIKSKEGVGTTVSIALPL